MKQMLAMVGLTLFTMGAQASEFDVYGWDISCKGAQGVTVHASQSDDDFYIQYQGGKLATGGKVWADSTVNWDARNKTLVFLSTPEVTPGANAVLTIVRRRMADARKATGGSYASGVLVAGGSRYDLNCYARFGKGEDDFDAISSQPFPAIREPSATR